YLASYDTFLVSVTAWASLQLTWTIVLLASQLWQIARQMTTLEVSNLGRYGYMGGRGGASYAGQMGHRHRHHGTGGAPVPGLDTEDTALVGEASSTESSAHHSHHHKHRSCGGCGSGFLMNLLGFDRFTKGKAVDGLTRAGKASNPFDLGFVGNCKDFWTKGKELGIEYEQLYDVPLEGFKEAKRRRAEREDYADGESVGEGRKRSGRKGLFMGLGIGSSSSARRGGYEPVSQA
ncbi:Palmitoyltransferase AKR1, partial [Leucoagaricus sp. SymC.cos]